MESTRAFWGALLFIVLILGANLIMYGMVRSITHSSRKDRNIFESMGNMFNPSNQKKGNSMDELRQKIEELNGVKKENQPDSKE
jgi:ABC-type oligopeptide transport system substrate-binding subunit